MKCNVWCIIELPNWKTSEMWKNNERFIMPNLPQIWPPKDQLVDSLVSYTIFFFLSPHFGLNFILFFLFFFLVNVKSIEHVPMPSFGGVIYKSRTPPWRQVIVVLELGYTHGVRDTRDLHPLQFPIVVTILKGKRACHWRIFVQFNDRMFLHCW